MLKDCLGARQWLSWESEGSCEELPRKLRSGFRPGDAPRDEFRQ